ncbi:DUF4270 domain-containing protein [Flavobacterium sediminis]|uniref:DUF4270 domain-containing protein n=1 Tax=Flavobacterium sediminis TaxID=2201181 RepID=A0A2U8QV38_9FLAO|nr:DUF4270 domain-containing protein [Flavobacterium sediminis]AWM13746.1 DUF4270 domain-containing protein [Flavobacterium sediminis]
MKRKKVLGFLGLMLLSLVSCDKDFNTVGADLIGDGNYNFNRYPVQHLTAYTRATGPVQTNNMPLNALGVFEDPVFGTTKASFVTQLELNSTDPDLGIDIEIQAIDSVYLYVPYFSTLEDTDDSGNNTYSLDSIHGNLSDSFDLKIYESGYLLRSYDAVNPSEIQRYYSDDKNLIEGNLVSTQLNTSTNTSQNNQFKFLGDEIVIYETDGEGHFLDSDGNTTIDFSQRVVKERMKPGMWLDLDKNHFLTRVLEANSTDLFNNNNFKEYFRGLYFQVTPNSGAAGALAKLDFSSGYIVIQYHSRASASADLKKKSLKLNLSGNTVNFLDNTYNTNYQNVLNTANSNDEMLYLKGGNGSVAFIDLFGTDDTDGNGVADELDEIREHGWMVNDAVLTFTIANDVINFDEEAKRIYLYDATNNTVLLDYTYDSTTASDAKYNKYVFGGILEVDDNDVGTVYKFRLLYYINNLLQSEDIEDLKNIRLGLAVTETIANVANYNLRNTFDLPVAIPSGSADFTVETVPLSSIMNPLGTVVYGNDPSVLEENRLKLEIYYTEPN